MSGTTGCPECGAEVNFSTPGAVLSVCTYCKSVVAKRGLDYEKLGKVAQIVELASPLRVGLAGKAHGGFRIVGRIQLDHGAGAWNEWYLALDNGKWLWLAEAQGRYYLSMPLGKVAEAPPFDSVRVGRTINVTVPGGGEQTLRATEVHTAKLVSAEGELPFEVTPGEPMRYVDLSGPRSSFGTLDYGASGSDPPLGFFGQLIRLEALQIDPGSMAAEPPKFNKAGKRMSCPQCDGALSLLAPDAAMRVTCPYCRALIDVSQEPLKALGTLKAFPEHIKPLFALGKKGTLRGREYTVLGFVRRDITTGEGGFWDEYLLWTGDPSDSAFHYLVESGGHFTLAEPINYGDVSGSTLRFYDGQTLRVAESCTTKVALISGEFPWAIEIGETVNVEDSVADGLMLSIETSQGKKEVNASFGHYLDSAEVWRGFQMEGSPPTKTYVAPHQPNPFLDALKRQKAILFWTTLCMMGLLGWSCARSGHLHHQFDLQTVPGVEPGAEHIVISDPFDLGKPGQKYAVEVRLRAEVDNSWVGVDASLINDESGQAFSVPLETAYYYGSDDGESWSEGSRSVDTVIPEVPAGRYVLRMEPSWPTNKWCAFSSDCAGAFICEDNKCIKRCTDLSQESEPLSSAARSRRSILRLNGIGECGSGYDCISGKCVLSAVPMTVRLSYPTTRFGYAFWLWLLLALVPGWTFLRSRSFEQRRTEDNE